MPNESIHEPRLARIFDGMVDGWRLASAGYRMWDSMLDRVEGAADGKRWHLKLGLMRRPKPILPK